MPKCLYIQENRLCSGARIIHDQDQEDPAQRPGPGRCYEKLDGLLSAQIKFQGQYLIEEDTNSQPAFL